MPKGNWQTHGIGKAASFLLGGTRLQYQQDPQNPNGPMQPTVVQMKPGELFRHVLGAGLLGLAAGATSRDLGSGFQKGYGAQRQQAEHDEAEVRQEAQQDFQNRQKQQEMQLKLNDDSRQQQSLDLQKQMGKANIEHLEAQKLVLEAQQARYHIENDTLAEKDYTANELYYAPQKAVLDAAGKTPKMVVPASSVPPGMNVFRLPVGQTKVIGTNGKLVPEQLVAVYDADDMKGLHINKGIQDQIVQMEADKAGVTKPEDLAKIRQRVQTLFPENKEMSISEISPVLTILQDGYDKYRKNKLVDVQIAEHQAQITRANAETALANFNLSNAREKKSLEEAFSLAVSGEKLTDKQEQLVKSNQVRVAGYLNQEFAAASKEFMPLAAQYNQMVKAKETPDENFMKIYKSASDRYDSLNKVRASFQEKFGGGAANDGSSNSDSMHHFKLTDGTVLEIPTSGLSAFKKDNPSAVPLAAADRAKLYGFNVVNGKIDTPKVDEGVNGIISKLEQLDPPAAKRLARDIKNARNPGRSELGGAAKPASKTRIQEILDDAFSDLNSRITENNETETLASAMRR
jgi:hypothetical protein